MKLDSSLTILTRVDLNLPGLRRPDRDGGYGRADVAQLPALVGGGRRVRLGHRRRKTMWVVIKYYEKCGTGLG